MATLARTIDVAVPVTVAYNHWARFEDFPQFMGDLEGAERLSDREIRFTGQFSGKRQSWTAEILEEIPDLLISWSSTSGSSHRSGTVMFSQQPGDGEAVTRVQLVVDYDPDDLDDGVGDKTHHMTQRIEGDLERFKLFVEGQYLESQGWTGRVAQQAGVAPTV